MRVPPDQKEAGGGGVNKLCHKTTTQAARYMTTGTCWPSVNHILSKPNITYFDKSDGMLWFQCDEIKGDKIMMKRGW